jgi:hypothetical protein
MYLYVLLYNTRELLCYKHLGSNITSSPYISDDSNLSLYCDDVCLVAGRYAVDADRGTLGCVVFFCSFFSRRHRDYLGAS